MKILAVLMVARLAISGCALLPGEHYVMSYGVEAGADSDLDDATFGVSATISGR